MRLRNLGLRGITEAFRDQVWVDFEGLGPGLIAIVGENGVGKSTLIGSAFAALFRQLPGQKGSLYDFCTHSQPEIDLGFSVNGEQYRSLLKLDPQARQMESYVFDCRGIAVVNGKKEAFAKWIGRHVGSSRLFLASLYSSQTRTGNFLGLERTQRRELFITELLGLDRLRLIAATAKEFADQAASKVVGLEGERRGLVAVLDADSKIEDLGELLQNLDAISAELRALEERKAQCGEELRQLQVRESERKVLGAHRQELQPRLDETQKEMTRIRRLIAGEDGQPSEGSDVSDLAGRQPALSAKIEELHAQIAAAQELEITNREVEMTLRNLETELGAKQNEAERSRTESGELASLPCGGKGFYAGSIKIRRSVQAEQRLPVLEGAISTLQLELEIQRTCLAPVAVSSTELTKRLRDCERERLRLDGLRKRAEELRVAAARRAECEETLRRLVQEEGVARDQVTLADQALDRFRDLLKELHTVGKQSAALDRDLSSRRADRERLIARKAQVEQQRAQVEAARARSATLAAELAQSRVERDDFDYLGKVFGPDEIQLCEIRSAGPGLSGLVNAMLEGCFDNKFEVRFRTERPKADGRGYVDDFDVEVRNKTLDRTCLVDELSGGQFVLVNEAVNLAIAIYNMRQGESIRYETLFRDETVGALDTHNAREYVRMLRHAMELGGFHEIIFICHQAQVWELADQVLEVRNGQVLVRSPAVT